LLIGIADPRAAHSHRADEFQPAVAQRPHSRDARPPPGGVPGPGGPRGDRRQDRPQRPRVQDRGQ
jgi:hypothetical protein